MSKCNNDVKQAMVHLANILKTIPEQNYINVDACNDFVLPLYWGFKDRTNTNFHIAYIRDGSGSYYFGQEEIKMEKGMLYFISSGYTHSRTLNPDNIPTIVLIRFDLCKNNNEYLSSPLFIPFAFAYNMHPRIKYNDLITKLSKTYNNSESTYASLQCSAILTEILCEIYQDIAVLSSRNAPDPRLQRAAKLVSDNLFRKLSVDEMAEEAELSKNHFRSLFKISYGMTPKNYIIHAKINAALTLLAESDCTIGQISDMLGYADQYSFSKQFKAVMGYSPSDFKRKFTKEHG